MCVRVCVVCCEQCWLYSLTAAGRACSNTPSHTEVNQPIAERAAPVFFVMSFMRWELLSFWDDSLAMKTAAGCIIPAVCSEEDEKKKELEPVSITVTWSLRTNLCYVSSHMWLIVLQAGCLSLRRQMCSFNLKEVIYFKELPWITVIENQNCQKKETDSPWFEMVVSAAS